jgi:hypothetical protein
LSDDRTEPLRRGASRIAEVALAALRCRAGRRAGPVLSDSQLSEQVGGEWVRIVTISPTLGRGDGDVLDSLFSDLGLLRSAGANLDATVNGGRVPEVERGGDKAGGSGRDSHAWKRR